MEGPTEKGIEKEKEKEALNSLVQPQLLLRDAMKLFFEEGDLNRVLKRITSVPGWREDTQLVKMFVAMRERKRWFLSRPFIEEDMEIVPVHVYDPSLKLPNLSRLSEEEQRLTILVRSFGMLKARNTYWKKAYEHIFSEIYAVKDWDQSPQLHHLHEVMKEEEQRNSSDVKYYAILERDRYDEKQQQKRKTTAAKILKQIKQQRKKEPIASQEQLLEHIRIIRIIPFWTDDEQLRNEHKKLAGELKTLRLKKDDSWKDRMRLMYPDKDSKGADNCEHSDDELEEHKSNSNTAPVSKGSNLLSSILSCFWKAKD